MASPSAIVQTRRPTVRAELVLNAAQRVPRSTTGRAAVLGEQRAQLGVEVTAGGLRLPEYACTHATDAEEGETVP